MKLSDHIAPIPAELAELAKDWQVERCYVFTEKEWSEVIRLRQTLWKGKWGMQW